MSPALAASCAAWSVPTPGDTVVVASRRTEEWTGAASFPADSSVACSHRDDGGACARGDGDESVDMEFWRDAAVSVDDSWLASLCITLCTRTDAPAIDLVPAPHEPFSDDLNFACSNPDGGGARAGGDGDESVAADSWREAVVAAAADVVEPRVASFRTASLIRTLDVRLIVHLVTWLIISSIASSIDTEA